MRHSAPTSARIPRRPSLALPLALALAVGGFPACGGRHTGRPDAGGDEPADAEADEPGDADQVRPDADPDRRDADEQDGEEDDEADEELVPSETSWLAVAGRSVGDRIHDVQPLPEGGMVVARWYGVSRLDAAGREVWSRSYGFDGVAVGPGGRIFAKNSIGWLGELDLEGRLVWQATVSPRFFSVAALGDGSLVAAGASWHSAASIEVMRYWPGEGIAWRRRARSSGSLSYSPVLAVSDEGTIFVAHWDWARGTTLVAMDLEGELLWSVLVTLGLASSAAATPDGGVVLAGRLVGLWAARLDRDGRLEWSLARGEYFEGDPTSDFCRFYCDVTEALDVAVAEDGEALVVGYTSARHRRTRDPGIVEPLAILLDPEGRVLRSVVMPGLSDRDRYARPLPRPRWPGAAGWSAATDSWPRPSRAGCWPAWTRAAARAAGAPTCSTSSPSRTTTMCGPSPSSSSSRRAPSSSRPPTRGSPPRASPSSCSATEAGRPTPA